MENKIICTNIGIKTAKDMLTVTVFLYKIN